ncbi:sigma-70 family RNA polymerase sigma factor [Candidatus Woesebacteria bacterium]|nr:sigma-70 family RNA polymerase sigma factor [Candidatus Woesebacteria bacterium]
MGDNLLEMRQSMDAMDAPRFLSYLNLLNNTFDRNSAFSRFNQYLDYLEETIREGEYEIPDKTLLDESDSIGLFFDQMSHRVLSNQEQMLLSLVVQIGRKYTASPQQDIQQQDEAIDDDSDEVGLGLTIDMMDDEDQACISDTFDVSQFVDLAGKLLDQFENPGGDCDPKIIKVFKRAIDLSSQYNLRLVISIAKKYRNQGLQFSDLIQEGYIGLKKAIDRFDVTYGYTFSTLAKPWIRAEISRAVKSYQRTIRVPEHTQIKYSYILQAKRETQSDDPDVWIKWLNENHPLNCRGWTHEHIEEIITLQQRADYVLSFEASLGDDDDRNLGDITPDPNDGVEAQVDEHLLSDEVRSLFENARLTYREALVLTYRFWKDMTLEDVANLPYFTKDNGDQISRERIRQIQNIAIGKIKEYIMGNGAIGEGLQLFYLE